MEAPDKIFKHITTGNRLLNGQYYEYKPAKIRYDDEIIEYIRKDALMEMLNKKLQESADRLDFHANQAYAEMINKLNLL